MESCWGQEESRAAGGAPLGATGAGGCGGCFCIFDEKKNQTTTKRDDDHLHAFGNALHVCSYKLFCHSQQMSGLAEQDAAAAERQAPPQPAPRWGF